MKKRFLLIVLTVLFIFSSGCTEEKKDPYEGRTCIKCGQAAAHSMSGAQAIIQEYGTLNSTNHKKSPANGVITAYFCDTCFDKIPVAKW